MTQIADLRDADRAGLASGESAVLERLSREALLTAAAVTRSTDSAATTELLYHANWLPFSPAWIARFPDPESVTRLLHADTETAALLRRRWHPSDDAHWFHWTRHRGNHSPGPQHKIYVSLDPAVLAGAFPLIVAVLAEHGAPTFKASRTPRELTRPDRLVIYPDSFAHGQTLGRRILQVTDGLPAQGVPFTAAFSASAGVSWAVDPPAQVRAYGASWRRWVAKKLAGYLHAGDSPTAPGRAQFALDSLQRDGVDTSRWRPLEGLWGTTR